MLSELRIELEADEPVGYYQASNMQGIIMEHIKPEYAEKLHNLSFNPYSQTILGREKKEWVIRTTTEEAFENIILPISKQETFEIKKKEVQLKVLGTTLKQVRDQQLLNEFYNKEADKMLNLEFQTPASFKHEGRYVIFPSVRFIFQSIMNKYSASNERMEMFDEETLEQLERDVEIRGYQLKSCFFPIEGIKIPAFIGRLRLCVHGSQTMARYARFLLRFSEYSGIGVKNSMGMGAVAYAGKEKA